MRPQRVDFSFFQNDMPTPQSSVGPSEAALEFALDHATISVTLREGLMERNCLSRISQLLEECSRRAKEVWVVFLVIRGTQDARLQQSFPAAKSSDGMIDSTLLEVCEQMRQQPEFIVGMADGYIGNSGTCLMAACDFLVASEQAMFIFVHELGPDVSEMVSLCLLRVVGVDLLKRLLETRGAIAAQMAEYLGFVSYTVPSSQLIAQQASIRSIVGFYSDAQLRQSREDRFTFVGSIPLRNTRGGQQPPASAVANIAQPTGLTCRDSSPTGREPNLLAHDFTDTSTSTYQMESAKSSDDGLMDSAKARNISKKKDLASQLTQHNGPITSLMLCNIPCRVTQESLGEAIDEMGFKDTYDFLYLPTAGRSAKTTGSNLGYGFINFVDPCYPGPFQKAFSTYTFPGTSSQKVLGVKVAHVQGLAANMRNFGQGNARRVPIIQNSQSSSSTWNVEWEMSL